MLFVCYAYIFIQIVITTYYVHYYIQSFTYMYLQSICNGASGHGGGGSPPGLGASHAPCQLVGNVAIVWLICWILWLNFMAM